MKWILITLAGAGLLGLGLMTKGRSAGAQIKIRATSGSYAPVAILELFTSEGCSSCPPADDLLPQLTKPGSNIIPLSFHVDYWNRLGWEDPFSSSEYSERQRQYGEQFHLESIYTPQLVINGEYELVGSNRVGAETAIKKALLEKMQVQLSIEDVSISNDKLEFTVHATGDLAKTDLLSALVQKHVSMNVKAGENKGATLSHINVVRSFVKQSASQKIKVELSIPKDLDGKNLPADKQAWELIVYAQQQNDLKITGATLYKPSY